jgi:hypothetical protein
MQTKKTRKLLFAILIPVAFILVLAVALLETVFFHVNPIKIGFHRIDYGKYVIFAKELPPANDYETISTIMSKHEADLGLHYISKVQMIFCEKQSDVGRYSPFSSATDRRNAVAWAPWPNTVYITPKAKEKYGTISGALGHELSHVLLIQNYGVIKTTLLWKLQEWIPEGFATYSNNWPNYFSKDQLFGKMKEVGIDMANGRLLGVKHAADVPLPIKYMIYRYFIEYLFQRNPSVAVIQFVNEASNNPKGTETAFEEQFKDTLENYVKMFLKSLNEN